MHTNKLKDNVARYSKTPAAGLVALSRIGQPTLLSDTETREALRAVAEAAATEKVLIAGLARDSVTAVLELAQFAEEIDYDAILVPLPSVLRGNGLAKQTLGFYRAVADSAKLPVIIDAGTGEVSVELLAALATHERIIGAVDASSDSDRLAELVRLTTEVRHEVTVTPVFAAITGRMVSKVAAAETIYLSAGALSSGGTALSVPPAPAKSVLKTRTKTVGFQVLSGRSAGMLEALEAGALGVMPPLAASSPQVCYEVVAAWKDGDPALAAEKQERLRALATLVESRSGVSGLIAAIKYGCDLNGYFGGRPRLPMLPLTGAEREEIERLMQGIRN